MGAIGSMAVIKANRALLRKRTSTPKKLGETYGLAREGKIPSVLPLPHQLRRIRQDMEQIRRQERLHWILAFIGTMIIVTSIIFLWV